MSRYKILDQHGPNFVTCTVVDWVGVFIRKAYKDILAESLHTVRKNLLQNLHSMNKQSPRHPQRAFYLAKGFFLFLCIATTAVSMQAQTRNILDSLNLRAMERQIELEMPAAEKNWFYNRNPEGIEDYMKEFSRDTFLIERVHYMLMEEFITTFGQAENDSTFWKQDEAVIGPIVHRNDSIYLAIYQQTAQRYDRLINRYVNLILKSSYGGEMSDPWKKKINQSQEAWLRYRSLMLEVQPQNDPYTFFWLIQLNKQRLLEMYNIYDSIM